MRARSQFIDEQFSVVRHEHLYRQQSDGIQSGHQPLGKLAGSPLNLLRHTGRHNRQMQDVVYVNVLGRRKALNLTGCAAGSNNRDFAAKSNEFLQHQLRHNVSG